MHGAEQDRSRHRDHNHSVVVTRNIAQALSDAAIEPVLDVDQGFLALV
jgi:hypothetical protein